MTVLLVILAIALLSLVLPARPSHGSLAQQSPWTALADRDDQRIGDELRFRAQS